MKITIPIQGYDERRKKEYANALFQQRTFSLIKNGSRQVLYFNYDFPTVSSSGVTEGKNIPSPYGVIKSALLIQLINDLGNEQISFKIMDECLEDFVLRENEFGYYMNLKENYSVALIPDTNIIVCKPSDN